VSVVARNPKLHSQDLWGRVRSFPDPWRSGRLCARRSVPGVQSLRLCMLGDSPAGFQYVENQKKPWRRYLVSNTACHWWGGGGVCEPQPSPQSLLADMEPDRRRASRGADSPPFSRGDTESASECCAETSMIAVHHELLPIGAPCDGAQLALAGFPGSDHACLDDDDDDDDAAPAPTVEIRTPGPRLARDGGARTGDADAAVVIRTARPASSGWITKPSSTTAVLGADRRPPPPPPPPPPPQAVERQAPSSSTPVSTCGRAPVCQAPASFYHPFGAATQQLTHDRLGAGRASVVWVTKPTADDGW
jgi:hypothetical protein